MKLGFQQNALRWGNQFMKRGENDGLKKRETWHKVAKPLPWRPLPFLLGPPRLLAILRYRIGTWFSDQHAREVHEAEPLIWLTLLFMLGIALYYAAPQEPVLAVVAPLAVLAGLAVFHFRRDGGWFFGSFAVFALMAGFAYGAFYTTFNDVLVLDHKIRGTFEGVVEANERRADGSRRLLVSDLTARGRTPAADLPERVRVRVLARDFVAEPGMRVRFSGELGPPLGPSMPGSYDFARDLYFKGIGASGFVFGKPTVLKQTDPAHHGFSSALAALRARISDRVITAFHANGQDSIAGVAMALLIGESGNVTKQARADLVASGLAHLLAISGLHMALVVTFIIGMVRAMLALHPRLALAYPIRSIAIVCGLATGLVYYFLSGGSVSATRAFVMVAIMTGALLVGRRALSVRNIALAALAVLLLSPYAIMAPGFQMSFAATLVLVSFSGIWFGRGPDHRTGNTIRSRLFATFKRYLMGLIVTSLLAGTATGLFAAFHFYRVAPLGLFANIIGVPLFSTLVMPFGFLGMVLMPFGYEALAFKVMGIGIAAVLAVAHEVAGWSNLWTRTGMLNESAVLLLTFALILACVMRSRLRLLLLPLFLIGMQLLPQKERPFLLVAEDGKTIAVTVEDKAGGEPSLAVSGLRSGRFEVELWHAALGLSPPDEKSKKTAQKNEKPSGKSSKNDGPMRCNADACVYTGEGISVVHIRKEVGFARHCGVADIIVSAIDVPPRCGERADTRNRDRAGNRVSEEESEEVIEQGSEQKTERLARPALVIDRKILAARGAQALYLRRDSDGAIQHFFLRSAISETRRPWHRHYEVDPKISPNRSRGDP